MKKNANVIKLAILCVTLVVITGFGVWFLTASKVIPKVVNIPKVLPLFSVLTPSRKVHRPFVFVRSEKLTSADVGYDTIRVTNSKGKHVDILLEKWMDFHYNWAKAVKK